jgi:hypothetical protein
MRYIPNDWTIKQNNLKIFLSKEQTFDDGIKLLLEMHGIFHDKKVYKTTAKQFMIFFGKILKKKLVK